MDTTIVVAIIGVVGTIVGLVISGFFGLLGKTQDASEKAATGRVEAVTERATYFKERAEHCEAELAECEAGRKEDHQTIDSQAKEIWALRQENYNLKTRGQGPATI